MSDRFEGTALLFAHDGVEWLHLVAVRENGDAAPHRLALPVRPKGTPPNPRQMTWEYTVHGDVIEVSPSVRVSTNDGAGTPERETFHNEGVWRVKFERFDPNPEIEWNNGVGDHGQRRRFQELNPGVLA